MYIDIIHISMYTLAYVCIYIDIHWHILCICMYINTHFTYICMYVSM